MMVWLDRFWPEVVHVNCLPQLKGAAAARALGLPVVWHLREILPPGARRRWLARRLRRDATRIVAVSHAVAGWLEEEGLGDRIEVVHNGCDAATTATDRSVVRAELGLPDDAVAIGYFAQLVEHKGVLDLVAAASRLMAEHDGLWVVIAGDGPEAELRRLGEAVAQSEDPQRFRLLPPRPEVAELLAGVDLAAVPSRWPDPLPRSVMEAMAAGLPVVASNTGGVPEMVVEGETGLLVPPGDIGALEAALMRLASDQELRFRFGAAAVARARREFSTSRHVDRMERVLSETAAQGARARSD
jgi:glycosyltransferase involved in cell wall biosynthesis